MLTILSGMLSLTSLDLKWLAIDFCDCSQVCTFLFPHHYHVRMFALHAAYLFQYFTQQVKLSAYQFLSLFMTMFPLLHVSHIGPADIKIFGSRAMAVDQSAHPAHCDVRLPDAFP